MLMVFRPPFGLNNDYGGNFKGGCPPVNGGLKGAKPPRRPRKLWFQWPRPRALVGTWGISLGVKPEIVGVAGTNMQWGHFVCHSSSQKRESTAFDLILRSSWGLLSPGKRVGGSSTPCRKSLGYTKWTVANIYAIESPVLEVASLPGARHWSIYGRGA